MDSKRGVTDAGEAGTSSAALTPDEYEQLQRYIEGGFDETLRSNEMDWERWRIVPRTFRDVSQVETATNLFGLRLRAPIITAPTFGQSLLALDGEAEVASAAAGVGLLYSLVAESTQTPQSVTSGAPYLQQVYLTADRSLQRDLIERSAQSGAVGLLLTVDQPGVGTNSFRSEPCKLLSRHLPPSFDASSGAQRELARDITPADVSWVAELSQLPVLVKGVLHPDDAVAAVDAGAAGVVVSNHGGRQLDGSITPALALPDIADAVGSTALVFADSGLRSAADVFRAFALGADAVLIGRPVLRGLAVGGGRGVVALLNDLIDQLTGVMANAGTADIGSITREAVRFV